MTAPATNPGSGTATSHTGVRLRRLGLWSFVIVVLLSLATPVAVYLTTSPVLQAQAAEEASNPRANFWRVVRAGEPGYTSESGPYTTNVLIQNGGQNWREFRNGPIAGISPWVLALIVLAIGLYHFIHGPQRIEEPLSGRKVERWSLGERVLHWYVATLFILLTLTGLSLLFGRAVLVPVIGLHAFSAYADFSKIVHNYLGPFFVVGVVLEFVAWVRYNIFNRHDMEWLRSLGGNIGGGHPHAGRTNGGEKVWFWIIATVGLLGVCVTGLILDFPNFAQARETMQLSQILHAIFSVIWIAVALGHIYLGVWGAPGTLDGMVTGEVSEEWMRKHHDLWLEHMQARGARGQVSATSAPGAAEPSGES